MRKMTTRMGAAGSPTNKNSGRAFLSRRRNETTTMADSYNKKRRRLNLLPQMYLNQNKNNNNVKRDTICGFTVNGTLLPILLLLTRMWRKKKTKTILKDGRATTVITNFSATPWRKERSSHSRRKSKKKSFSKERE